MLILFFNHNKLFYHCARVIEVIMHTFSPKATIPFRPATAYEVMSNASRRRILDYLRINGSTELYKLADEFGLSNLKICHHIELLRDSQLIRVSQVGSSTVIAFSPIGWARLKKQWENAMEGRLGMRVLR